MENPLEHILSVKRTMQTIIGRIPQAANIYKRRMGCGKMSYETLRRVFIVKQRVVFDGAFAFFFIPFFDI